MDNQSSVKISIFSLAAACIALSIYISYSVWSGAKQNTNAVFAEDSAQLNYRLSSQLNDIIKVAVNNAQLASYSPILRETLVAKQDTQKLQESWSNMFQFNPSLYQIRFLDVTGMEVYRFERTNDGFQWAPEQQLQDKSKRDYFIDGISVEQTVYVSAIDLNAEQGKIEVPYRPTIRVSAKVMDKNQVQGMVVLNFDLREAFAFFELQQSNLEHWIVKENGYFLSAPGDREWGWLLGNEQDKVETVFSDVKINQDTKYSYGDHWLSESLYISLSNLTYPSEDVFVAEDRFWIITVLPKAQVNRLEELALAIIVILAVVLLIIVGVARYIDILLKTMRNNQKIALELADKAQASERSKASFLAQMSHEIRTPMNGLYGLLQLTSVEQDQKKVAHNVKNALRSFESLRRIIDDILDFSKIEAGKLTLLKQPFSLDVALSDIAQMMSRAAYGKNIDMWIDIDDACPRMVNGDVVRLNQILFNLTNNAIKFTEEGEISIRVKLLNEDEKAVRLGFTVSDTGIGMSDEEGLQIFESFTQASDNTHIKFGGSGLGLSIVKQLINLMDGNISLNSSPGKGSVFNFDIRVEKAPNSAKFAEPEPENKTLYLQTVIVTPSVKARTILQKQVATLGWLSQSCESIRRVPDIISTFSRQRIILLIDDNALKDVRAIALLKKIKVSHPKVILQLIASAGERSNKAQNCDIFDVVTNKPITPSVLYDAYLTHANDSKLLPELIKGTIASQSLSEVRVMIVEDNEINQMVAASMLETAGAIISLAANGQECLDKLEQADTQVHVILMDMQMPIMGGIEATLEIRKNPKYDAIPIVALTANAMEEEREECFKAGMQAHLAKPMERSELIQTVLKVMHDHPY